MKSISLDVLRGSVKIVCLLILTAASVSSLTNSITSFAATKPAKVPVKIGQAKLKNGLKKVLTNAKGLTLYYYGEDQSASDPKCSPSNEKNCPKAWPPLLFKGILPATIAGLPAGSKLELVKNPNGSQVTFNGRPLYTYKDDKKAGTASGDGEGQWHAAVLNTPPLSAALA